jgi:hypothetical protein
LHKEGKHTESMKALAEAKKILGIWRPAALRSDLSSFAHVEIWP